MVCNFSHGRDYEHWMRGDTNDLSSRPRQKQTALNLLQYYLFELQSRNTRQKERRGKRATLELHGDPSLRLILESVFFQPFG